jgi:site-specific DNA recombinase
VVSWPVLNAIDAYTRVSRVGGRAGDSFIAPRVQREAIQHHADAHGLTIAQWHEDLDESGGTMMARVEAEETGGVIVARLDRFGRSLIGSLAAIERITAVGGTFVSTTENFDTSSPMGEFALHVFLAMGQMELRRIRDSWALAGSSAVERGIHIAPTVPYGYDKGADKRLAPNDAAPFVVQAFEMRADGATWQAVADWLNANAPARADGRPWVEKSVERMVSRRVYTGVAHWGKNENSEAHPALVDDVLFTSAQRRIQTYSRTRQGDVALLHGIVRCAGCRFQMSRALNRSGGRERHYYRCRVHRVSGTCKAPAAVRADAEDGLEAFVEQIVMDALDARAATYANVDDSDTLASALEELQAAEETLNAYLGNTDLIGIVGQQRYNAGAMAHQSRVEAAQEAVSNIRDLQGADTLGLTSEGYIGLSREDRSEVLRAMIDVVFVKASFGPRGPQAIPLDSRRVRILWRGQASDDLPGRNVASDVVPWTGFEDNSSPRSSQLPA